MARKGVMLCYPYEDKRFKRWGSKAIIQPKLDGIRCRVVITDGKVTLYSSSAKEIVSVPHINRSFAASGLVDIELDGELYEHSLPLEYINSIVSRTKNLHYDHKVMEYHVFDIVSDAPQEQRLQILLNLHVNLIPYVQRVRPQEVTSLEILNYIYKGYLEDGYEGFILRQINAPYARKRSTSLLKCKPRKIDSYQIVGYLEEHSIEGEPKNTLGALKLLKDGEIFNVGSGFTRDERIAFWENKEALPGKWCTIKYQDFTADRKVPKFQSFVSIQNLEG